ncbi:methyltransferase-like protein 27 [Pagrus major]|uniref:methyltransferase-like protein 27 n=1 Tax=Pagrus major TaxID=143350 RepID=UPI003CC86769
MADCSRTVDDIKRSIRSCDYADSKETTKFYDRWAQTYEQDMMMINYRPAHLAVDFLNANFCGRREEVQVLDVGCGTGLVAKLMFQLGFRHFVGVEGSKGMLDQAVKTGLYQDLRLALLGTQRLPAETGMFDVVILVSVLCPGYAPVSVVRELCHATKPGGFICIAKGLYPGAREERYKKDLDRELQLMEDEGLWSLVGNNPTDRYMENSYLTTEADRKDEQEERYISGNVYLYKKSIDLNR